MRITAEDWLHKNKLVKLLVYIPLLIIFQNYAYIRSAYILIGLIFISTICILGDFDHEIKKANMIPIGVFCLLYSLMVVVREKVSATDNLNASVSENYMDEIWAIDIVMIFVGAFVLMPMVGGLIRVLPCVAQLIRKVCAKVKLDDFLDKKKLFLYLFCSFLIIWGIGYLSFFPGTIIRYDALYALRAGPVRASDVSPIIFNFAVYGCIKLGMLIGYPNLGVALFCVLQMIITAVVFSYIITWLYGEVESPVMVFVVWALFALHPIYALLSFTMVKDMWYSLAIFMWLPFMYKEATGSFQNQKLRMIMFCVLIIFTMISRNNGFIVAPCLVLTLILFSKNMRRKYAIAGSVSVAVVMLLTRGLMGGVEHNFAESVGPILQQIAMVYAYDGDIEPDDREFLNQILPEEGGWTDSETNVSYAPMCSDNLKYNIDHGLNSTFLNSHRMEFLGAYFRVFINNPDLCIEAYLLNTYGFWEDKEIGLWQSCVTDIEENEFGIYQVSLLPEVVDGIVSNYYRAVWSIIGIAGNYTWMLFFIILSLFLYGKKRYVIILFPMLLNWVVIMMATPIAFAFRYVYYYLMEFPVLMVLLAGTKAAMIHREK
ncbi:DUF6020 family protein [Butyrivibrio sp. FC2001]|uniref:DUF6020 family protein n=1 Tax=Butyrivibrio sp. FC2001 TaxID=1280671 RepID=UPI0004046E72|nr:DUF6020 family protein [Butyrivibrio sp. FC2001]